MSLHSQPRLGNACINETLSELYQPEAVLYKTEDELKWDSISQESLPSIYFTLDSRGVVLAVNPLGTTGLGYSVEELIEKPIFSLFHPGDRTRLQVEFATFAQHPAQVVKGKFRLLRKDGSSLLVKVTAQALQAIDAKTVFLLTADEITEHPLLEKDSHECEARSYTLPIEALRESEEKYRLLFSNELDAIVLVDVETGELLDVNQAFVGLYGYSREEALGMAVADVTAEQVNIEATIQQASLEGKAHIYLGWHKKKDGTVFPVELCVGSFIWKGRSVMYAVVRDITERQRAEEVLRQSEERLRSVLENMPVMMNAFDANWNVIIWNRECERVTGYKELEIVGNPKAMELLYPNPKYRQQMMATWAEWGHDYQDWEWEITCKDGSVKIISWFNICQRFPIPGWATWGVGVDVTDRKRAQEALRQQFQRERLLGAIAQRIRQSLNLEEILNTTVAEVQQFLAADRVLIYRLWPNGTGSAVTEAVVPGWPAVLGKIFPEKVFPQESQQLYRQGRILAIDDVEQADISACLVEFVQQFGVKAKLVIPILQEEALWGLLIAHQCRYTRQWQPLEIDWLKQLATQLAIAIQQSQLFQQVQRLNANLERQVQARTAELQLAFEFEATLKRITDRVRDSLDEGQILQTAVQELAIGLGVKGCNAALYDLDQGTSTISYEYTTSLAPAKGRVSQMAAFPEIYGQLLKGQCFQFCSIFPNPLRGHLAMLTCPIIDNQGVLGDLWLSNHSYYAFHEQDIRLVQQVANQCAIAIRQARLYQTAQAQVEELEKLNRLKDDFLSTVSHELRTPVSNINMATQMLEIVLKQIGILDAETNKAARYFQILHDECQREIGLINNLLDLSRLDAGTEPLMLTTIEPRMWILSIAEAFVERAESQQQDLRFEIPSELPALTTDLSHLERILIELLNNACKYTPAGGTITVSAQVKAGILQLRMSNSGIEIPERELTHIFDKFYRIPNNDPWKHGGTGLGLALVKKLVEHLGGSIQVESFQGQTTFTLQLPFT
jgi:PAS domain S-box-containing protein